VRNAIIGGYFVAKAFRNECTIQIAMPFELLHKKHHFVAGFLAFLLNNDSLQYVVLMALNEIYSQETRFLHLTSRHLSDDHSDKCLAENTRQRTNILAELLRR
jgi:hypothetical protein